MLNQEEPLEKGMVTHSSMLVWRLSWTEEPGGLQSMKSQSQIITERLRVHTQTHTHTHTQLFCMVQIEMHIILHSSLQEEENELKSKAAVYLCSSEEGASISLPTLATHSYNGNWDL